MDEILKSDSIEDIMNQLEAKYGKEWYNAVHIEIHQEGKEYIAKVTPLNIKKSLVPGPDLKQLAQALSKRPSESEQQFHTELEEKIRELALPKIQVTVSEDEMKAYVTIFPGLEKELPDPEEIEAELRRSGVVFGFCEDEIRRIVKERILYTPVLVAEGKQPTEPVDARIEYNFPKAASYCPTDITTCSKGDVLAVKVPCKDGEHGFTVTGREIPSEKGKDLEISKFVGENVEVVDGDKIVSKIDGQPYVDEMGRVHVKNVLVVDQRFFTERRTLNFPGTIIVKSNLEGICELTAGKDIFIGGLVSGCVKLTAEGNITVSGGVFGKYRSILKARGNVSAKFLNEVLVISEGDVIVADYIMNSEIVAKRTVIVSGKGQIVGGSISAGELIDVKVIGNVAGTVTHVNVGIDHDYETRRAEINYHLKEILDELNQINVLSEKLREFYQIIKDEEEKQRIKSSLIGLNEKKKHLVAKIEELRRELKGLKLISIEARLKRNPKLVIRETCYPGVVIKIVEEQFAVPYELGPRALNLKALLQLKGEEK
ncbi:DUF342 domain-containing protein [Fervidobacterium thailandense]|uniref:Flagellar Assembly Protein A N-terminal region domain-containing protein n=1 Tax=Fervidobacterium thailandense TaxID=1008305 RepID=A0A1E3G6D7_9BACT|nr:FapA family protein [Fervidobacterium thailandense]ODN31433.1 hypothetical protein A4H02_01380 [Fervidobacterium thailandense]